MLYYSYITNSFYDSSIHSSLPDGCVEIGYDYHQELIDGQSKGKLIIFNDVTKLPELQDKPPLSEEDLKNQTKMQAKKLLLETDWAMLSDVPLKNRLEFESYRSFIRNLVINPVEFPEWPEVPQPIWN